VSTWSRVLFVVAMLGSPGTLRPARAEPPGYLVPVVSPSASERVARMVARGQRLREAGDTLSALAYFRDAISAAPRRPEGYAALGELYLAIDEPARALEVFETGTRNVTARSAEESEALWLGLASTLRALGQHERALGALRTLRQLAPAARGGLEALADATEARGSFVEALATRRALVALLAAGEPEERDALLAQRARVRALEVLLGGAERVRRRGACLEDLGVVRRALARCP
jgi:tetratricopeptide (TPR) repeat protein